jgi:hypothetical protein
MSVNVEEILDDLYASEINVEISWLWDGGIDVKVGRRRGVTVKLGDPRNGYDAKGQGKIDGRGGSLAQGSGLPALPGQ